MILRSSGVQLHPTSLASGRLGSDAYRFVDWLRAAGQSWWQVLPLGPPDRSHSPYKARSAFACWHGLLADPQAPVRSARRTSSASARPAGRRDWERLAGGRRAVRDQVRFDREWGRLRAYAAGAGRAADRRPADLRGAGERRPSEPSGAVPDRRGGRGAAGRLRAQGPALGQPAVRLAGAPAAGLPLVDERLRRSFELFDVVRIDHFRGFVAYWSIPADAPDATDGRWRAGAAGRRRSARSSASSGRWR